MILSEPYEYLDLLHMESMILRVDSYTDGSGVIHPKRATARHVRIHMEQRQLTTPPVSGTPISVEVPVLRLYGERLDQFSPSRYYDISSKTLRADLLARFAARPAFPVVLTLQAHGAAPAKRYSVSVA